VVPPPVQEKTPLIPLLFSYSVMLLDGEEWRLSYHRKELISYKK